MNKGKQIYRINGEDYRAEIFGEPRGCEGCDLDIHRAYSHPPKGYEGPSNSWLDCQRCLFEAGFRVEFAGEICYRRIWKKLDPLHTALRQVKEIDDENSRSDGSEVPDSQS
jgi:hypothetical protein